MNCIQGERERGYRGNSGFGQGNEVAKNVSKMGDLGIESSIWDLMVLRWLGNIHMEMLSRKSTICEFRVQKQ